MKVPNWPQSDDREQELIKIVLQSTQWGGFHPFVKQFEQQFAEYQHCRQGISAANGTLTLELILASLGIGTGDEVIVPAISFISTATSVSRVGAIPVFVDIEPTSFNIDPHAVEQAISPQTRAIVAVHFGGAMAQVIALQRLAEKHSLFLIEDAAHAHGSEWDGQRAGSFGIVSSFSFQNGKAMCAGEGGIVLTSNEDTAARARSIANQGRLPGHSFYQHFELGSNFRMTGFQAAVLLSQFERLPRQIKQRTAAVRRLKEHLAGTDCFVWQSEPQQITQNSYYLLPSRLRGAGVSRDRFVQKLTEAGVPCTPFYPHTLYKNQLYQSAACRVLPCPQAEGYVKDAFWLPHRLLLADDQTIDEVAEVMKRAVTRWNSTKVGAGA